MSPQLSPQLFAILSALVEERFGLHYGLDDLPLFSDKVSTRASDAGFESILDYYYYLRYDESAAPEISALADALVVGETYLFRELTALRAAVENVIVPAVTKTGRARVWSAACATGEEPLSIAMVLLELGVLDRCEIVGTDLSPRALARARLGTYSGRSLRVLPPSPPGPGMTPRLSEIAAEHVLREGTGARVLPSLVSTVTYKEVNLLDASTVAGLGTFDLVLCRNVLIYFADATVVRVVGSLARALGPKGALLVGASESLLRFGTVLQCTERGGAFLYTKRGPS